MLKPELLAREALKSYGIGAARLTLLQADRQIVFKVRSPHGVQFTLRIYPPGRGTRRAIWSQCQWLAALASDTDLIVPEPVANIDGEEVTSLRVAGVLQGFGTLTRWVPGVRRFLSTGPGERVLHEVGRLMARLHLHGQKFRPPQGFRCPRWDCDGLFAEGSPWFPEYPSAINPPLRRMFSKVICRARTVMESLGAGRAVFGLIHGDLMQANYVVHNGSVHAIDFADFGRGYFLYDMAVNLLMLRPFDRSGRQREAFLRGYREIRPLAAANELLIEIFLAVRAVVLCRSIYGSARPEADNLNWVAATLPWLKDLAATL